MILNIDVPEVVKDRVLEAFATNFQYKVGTETKAQFAKRKILEYIKGQVKLYEGQKAQIEAGVVAIQKVENEIILS